MKRFIKDFKYALILFGLALITLVMSMVVPEDPPRKKKLAQDTMKMDTVPIQVQQEIYLKQSTKQMNRLDTLLLKKFEKSKK